MTSPLFSVMFPTLLLVVMFGLGMGLTVADFTHVLAVPRAVLVTLLCQVVLLPALCFALVVGSGLGPDLAVGMMVLAAAPGGPMAGVFSHLAGGDVALNITVTAVNSVLAVFTLPVVVAASVRYFLSGDAAVGVQADKLVQIGLLVLAPVAAGMAARRWAPAAAERLRRPLWTLTLVAVFLAICAATVLHNPVAAVAPAMYGALMYLPLSVFSWLVRRHVRQARPTTT